MTSNYELLLQTFFNIFGFLFRLMRLKLMPLAVVIVIAISGCLKDTKQPASHINDVNVSLTGTWTQTAGTIIYYDNTGKKVYQGTPLFLNLQFDGNATVNVFENQPLPETKQTYSITTLGNVDYVNITSNNITDSLRITLLQARSLKLTETLNYPAGTLLVVGGKSVTYYQSVQANTYAKRNLSP